MGSFPVVQEGERDSEESNGVIKVQRLLRQHGLDVVADHEFGPATTSAVRAFQESNGLAVDGIVGDETWSALIVEVRQGDDGEAVLAVQSQWRFIVVDGIFGPRTDALVRSFQAGAGIGADGIVGAETWQAMGNGPIIDAPPDLRSDAP